VRLSEADTGGGRRQWRWAVAVMAIAVFGLIVGGESVTPRTNAVIALCVFGGLLGLVLVLQRRKPRGGNPPNGEPPSR
jgi:hydrogenase/urease accessory protein HupE